MIDRLPYSVTVLNTAYISRYNFFYKNGVPKWRGTGYCTPSTTSPAVTRLITVPVQTTLASGQDSSCVYATPRISPSINLSSFQTVLVFLTLLSSGLQYVVQRMNYKRDIAIVERTVTEARLAAWGAKLEPLSSRRKVKVSKIIYLQMTHLNRRMSGESRRQAAHRR